MLGRIADYWCRTMHRKAMWPIHGRYICPQCLRERRVEWEPLPILPRPEAPPASKERDLAEGVHALS